MCSVLNMKILQVIHYFVPAWGYGGPVVAVYNLSKELVKRGHEVTVYTTDTLDAKNRIKETEEIIDGIKIRRFRNLSNTIAHNYNLFLSPAMLLAMRRELANFNIIHMYEQRNPQNIIVHRYAKKYGTPYIIEAQGSVLPHFQKQRLKKTLDLFYGNKVLRDASRVIAGTEAEIEEYKAMGLNRDKISFFLPGYDTDSFAHPPLPSGFRKRFNIKEKHIILFLARIHRIKGVDFLVRSFHKLTKERNDIILAIVGPDDGFKPVLDRLISELDIADKVLFTGLLEGEDKLSALVDADMLVQTSIYERAPGSPFEAVLCGTPIIVTKDTGAGGVVSKLDAGYLVKYGDVNELKGLMKQILDDPTEANIKTQRAKQYIINNLSWQKKIEEYEAVYREVINCHQVR